MQLDSPLATKSSQWPYLLALLVLGWALLDLPPSLEKSPGQFYLLQISPFTLLKLAFVFYGWFVLPGLLGQAWILRDKSLRRFFSARRVLLAFAFGCCAHVGAMFLQKYSTLPYRALPVLACLLLSYGLLAWFAKKTLPLQAWLAETPCADEAGPFESGLTLFVSLLALALAWELTLRGRASSVNLVGDGYPHLINLLGTLEDGPLPDALPFYSTFVTNIHPMGFHALWADLKVLTPGLLHIDLFRYFSVLMVPLFYACVMGFFSVLSSNRLIAALGAAATLFISGGGLSLKVPIVYFPWYWSLAWCLAAAVFYLLVKDRLEHRGVAFWAGLVFGVGVLMHPFFAFRMGIVMLCFLPLELLRRGMQGEKLGALLGIAASFALGAVLPVLGWIVPLVLRHGWEPTYSYEYIVTQFKDIAPEGVAYIQKFQEARFDLVSLYTWSRANAGLFPLILAPLGIYAALRQGKRVASALLLAWFFGMALALWLVFLPNRYRYFEFLFFAEAALAVYGLSYLWQQLSPKFRPVLGALALALLFWSIRADFIPKYQYTLALYGSTELSEAGIRRAEGRSQHYLKAKRAGELDSSYGNYTGYLWSRQKKLWDIYVANQRQRKEKAQ